MFIDYRERGRKRKWHIHVREKHHSVASHMCPDRGSNLQPRYVPWLGIEPPAFWWVGNAPTNWAALARARCNLLFFNYFIVVQLQLSPFFPYASPLLPPHSILPPPPPLSLSMGLLYMFLDLTFPFLSPITDVIYFSFTIIPQRKHSPTF